MPFLQKLCVYSFSYANYSHGVHEVAFSHVLSVFFRLVRTCK